MEAMVLWHLLEGVLAVSVVKGKRTESEMEFVHTARELQIYTVRKCVGFPKRYTFYISQPLANAATRIHECVKMANSVYPTNAHEAQLRRDYLLQANAELNSFVSQIEVAHEIFGIDPEVMKFWMDLVNSEIRLVRGAMRRDRDRYKNLP